MKYRVLIILLASFLPCALCAMDRTDFIFPGEIPGIPENYIMAACQDKSGMMWLGTKDGLIRFDGSGATVFRPEPDNPSSIYSNNIADVCPDGEGGVYVLCKYALCHFDPMTDSFRTIRENGVLAIAPGQSSVWACCGQDILQLSSGSDSLVLRYRIPGERRVYSLLSSSGSNFYIGTSDGLFLGDANGHLTLIRPGICVLGLYEDSKQGIWVSTREHGAFCLAANGRERSFRKGDRGMGSDYVRSSVEDAFGNIWLATLNGIECWFPDRGIIENMCEVCGLGEISVFDIFRDAQGTMWICTSEGLYLYNSARSIFNYHRDLFPDNDPKVVKAMAESADCFFYGTEENGLIRQSKADGSISLCGGLSSQSIRSLYMDPDGRHLWVGTRLGGLDRLDVGSGEVRVWRFEKTGNDSYYADDIYKIVPFGSKLLLILTKKVLLFDPATGTAEDVNVSPRVLDKRPTDLLADSGGNSWTAVSDGLLRHNLSTGEEKEYFFEDKGALGTCRINASFQDSGGRIWFGTSGNGLLLYEPESDSFRQYSSASCTICNDYIWAIGESPGGYLLLTCNGGFVKFDPDKESFFNYTPDTGFPLGTFVRNGLFVSSTGEIFVMGGRMVLSFHEHKLVPIPSPSGVYFASLSGAADGPSSFLYAGNAVTLGGRDFSVRTVAPDFFSFRLFKYKLEGWDKEWKTAQIGERLAYSGLAPGRYILKVKSMDMAGNPGMSRELAVKVPGSIFRTPLAIVLIFLAAILVSFLLFRSFFARLLHLPRMPLGKKERDFLQDATDVVMKHLTDTEFDVDKFAAEMSLGRTVFYNMMKGASGMTPNHFVNSVRLRYSRTLLRKEKDMTISEIAYMCGFSSPSYYIKCFKETYGLTPASFRENPASAVQAGA